MMDKCYVCHQKCEIAIVQDTYTGLCSDCYAKVRSLIGGAPQSTIEVVGHLAIARPDTGPGIYVIDRGTGEVISRPISVCLKCGRKAVVLSNVFPYCEDCIGEVIPGD